MQEIKIAIKAKLFIKVATLLACLNLKQIIIASCSAYQSLVFLFYLFSADQNSDRLIPDIANPLWNFLAIPNYFSI